MVFRFGPPQRLLVCAALGPQKHYLIYILDNEYFSQDAIVINKMIFNKSRIDHQLFSVKILEHIADAIQFSYSIRF